jgi:hypothetical protein
MVDARTEWGHISKHVSEDKVPEDFYVFTLRMCDTRLDSANEKMTEGFIQQFSDSVNMKSENNVPISLIKNHDAWDVENTCGCIYRSEVITDESELDEMGIPVTYAHGYVFTPIYSETVEAVKNNQYNSVSCSFGQGEYEDIIPEGGEGAYRLLTACKEALEVSFVVLPCQERAAVSTKSKPEGGSKMSKQVNTKAAQAKETEPTVEALQARIVELEAELADTKAGSMKALLSKAIDALNPLTAKVKENMLRDADVSRLSLKDGEVEGLEEVLAELVEEYSGLFTEEDHEAITEGVENVLDNIADAHDELVDEAADKDGEPMDEDGEIKTKQKTVSAAAKAAAKKAVSGHTGAKVLMNQNTKNRQQFTERIQPKSQYSKRGL